MDIVIKKPVVFLGVGSQIRGDDAWAFHFLSAIQQQKKSQVYCLWGETTPENLISTIEKITPVSVIICDAAEINELPGKFKWFKQEDLAEDEMFLSHRMSLTQLADFIDQRVNCDIYFLLMQPENIEFSMKLSPVVEQSLQRLIAEVNMLI